MSMNWTQYLLGKFAEEATEVAKEALKNQQQGVASPWRGKPAIFEVRKEFLEMVAVAQMLDQQEDVGDALGAMKYLAPIPSLDGTQDRDIAEIILNKIGRVCYYAMSAYESGNLTLTKHQFDEIWGKAISYGAAADLPYCGHIEFRH